MSTSENNDKLIVGSSEGILEEFERGLDPTKIESSGIPAKVLGYGEISTVFQIGDDHGTAYKRMPLFSDPSAAESYMKNYHDYCRFLTEAGLKLPEDSTEVVETPGRPVVLYILQQKLSAEFFCHNLIHMLDRDEISTLLKRIVVEVGKIWKVNEERTPSLELALDGQLSNWVLDGDISTGALTYIDTSTPLYRIDGEEQLDPELFLKSAPSFIRWIIRWLFLDDVMNRYYNQRQVLIDLVANLYKEQRVDLVPLAVEAINETAETGENLLTVEEIEKYYKEDKFIWVLFLAFRRLDRWLTTKIFRKRYEFILPGKIKR